MSRIALSILGNFQVSRGNGKFLRVAGQKDRALLAYLALSPGVPFEREKLAGLLWGDHGDTQARDSLKHALSRLRKLLNDGLLQPIAADRQAVWLDPKGLSVDVAEFEVLLRGNAPGDLDKALALYRGDLLQNTTVQDPAFDDWLMLERQRLRRMAEDCAGKRAADLETQGDHEQAARAAARLLQLDPLHEAAARALMRLYSLTGERNRALRVYADLSERLARDLDTQPEAETTALCEQIKSRGTVTSATAPRTGNEAAVTRTGASPMLPGRPSIAVLPFESLSPETDQDYFADGVVEEIITALSRVRSLFVIARNSSFAYKGKAIDVQRIGRELGVRYVVEGSLRRSADRIRIMARLVEAANRATIWAESFDGDLSDIFELQDQIAARIVGAILPKLEQAEIARALEKPTANLDAYDYFLRGMAAFHRWTHDGNDQAMTLFGKATDCDAGYAAAYGMAARTLSQRKACGWTQDSVREVEQATRLALKAAELGAEDALALSTAGLALGFVANRPEAGAPLVARALALNPNLASAWMFSGWIQTWLGHPDRAIDHLERALRLSPNDPQTATMQAALALAYLFSGKNEAALLWSERSVQLQPNLFIAHCILAASLAQAGRDEEANQSVARIRQINPGLRLSNLLQAYPISRARDVAVWTEALRRAGLPE